MAWKIDPAHSEINFTVRHMMISNVRGRFEHFTGTVDFDTEHPEKSTVQADIDANSISTRDPQRDTHLRSADFLNSEKYPLITFKSKRIELVDESHGRIIGDLTIRSVTKEVSLDVEFNGMSKSPHGNYHAGFSAVAQINRKNWGLTWNVALETGGVLVGDEIKINIELEAITEEEPEAIKSA